MTNGASIGRAVLFWVSALIRSRPIRPDPQSPVELQAFDIACCTLRCQLNVRQEDSEIVKDIVTIKRRSNMLNCLFHALLLCTKQTGLCFS